MRDSYMRGGQGFLIVFAVNSMLSFNEVSDMETPLPPCPIQQPTVLSQVKTFREQILRAKDSSKVRAISSDRVILVFDTFSQSCSCSCHMISHSQVALQVPIVLVGNKCDIPDREVTKEQGQALAESFGVPYFESSAKERLNVDESFHALVSIHLRVTSMSRINQFFTLFRFEK